jgi:hypothetical protein
MTQNSGLSSLSGLQDPMVYLLDNQIQTADQITNKQASESMVLEDLANGSNEAISGENSYLATLANNMSTISGPSASEKMTSASTFYNVQSTIVSNRNNDYNTGVSSMGTLVTNETPELQFVMQFCQSTVDFTNGVDQCVKSWAS